MQLIDFQQQGMPISTWRKIRIDYRTHCYGGYLGVSVCILARPPTRLPLLAHPG
jgi:hypothetical protein